ncbi:MAG: tetrahydromethanopterin S-methyltransferase subunit H family protein [Candidatus Thorarchaeota archaeon]|jgi:tetrahydromethanopterin S-methyltransferase subunit H
MIKRAAKPIDTLLRRSTSQKFSQEKPIVFDYSSDQKILEIGNMKIGGQPGKNATVLIPSLFYTKDKLVLNAETGEFDKAKTEVTLNMLQELTGTTGLPTMLDVVATSCIAIDEYLRYLADATEFPLLIDGSDSAEVNASGIMAAKEAGFLDRVVLNSITPTTEEELYQVIRDAGLLNALLLTFDAKSMISFTKRVELADELIKSAQEAGIVNIMIDTGVLDIPTLGIACKTQDLLKDKYGYPVGNGAHNAISTWKGLLPKFGKDAKTPAVVGSSLMPVSLGADFVLIGPAKHAPVIYPSVAMIDAALSGILIESRERPEKPHPRFLIS